MGIIKKIWFNEVILEDKQLDFLFDFLEIIDRDLKRKQPKKKFRIIVEELERNAI